MAMEEQTLLRESFQEGRILLIDKPYQWTSFDVVNKLKSMLRYSLRIKKIRVGHAGTLDPLATGLLIVCTGKATKKADLFRDLSKTYTGTMVLGQSTPSFDLETQVSEAQPVEHLDEEKIKNCALRLTGPQMQMPPQFSAKKVGGERAYLQARQGLSSELTASPVHIEFFHITRIALPEVDFRVQCSKGTYIRALARDFGMCLETGAYLSALRRTHIGTHCLDNALNMSDLKDYILCPGPGKSDIAEGS